MKYNLLRKSIIWLYSMYGIVPVSEAVAQRCSAKKVFLKFRKIHRKTPVLESLF